jgi:hypothetical protein
MKAIHTKYIPASNTKGSRIKAYVEGGLSATISYPHEYSYERCHFEAVKTLVEKHKLHWDISNMRFGDSADGKGYTFCFDDSKVAA